MREVEESLDQLTIADQVEILAGMIGQIKTAVIQIDNHLVPRLMLAELNQIEKEVVERVLNKELHQISLRLNSIHANLSKT